MVRHIAWVTACSALWISLAGAASPPSLLATFPEKPVLAQLPDGTLLAFFLQTVDGVQEVAVQQSKDLTTWTERATLLKLDLAVGGWALPLALVDKNGAVHLFFLNDAHTGVILADEASRPKAGALRDRRLEIWHARSTGDLTQWSAPKRIWEGYTGALNSAVQLKAGRILLPFSFLTERRWDNRGEGLDAFTYRGQFDSTLVYSDDGETWQTPPVDLRVPVPDIVSAYGAVEPVVLERKDGSVWMLIRTQQGRFYESFSQDGSVWSIPRPGPIASSDSPGGIVRTTDGRIVLLWNNCQRFPYAYGGRQVLHAAVSTDEGRTWHGYREIARDPLRDQPPPARGDHGTAYPFPIALTDGRVAFATGQGDAARIACKVLEPDWLMETKQSDDFSGGLETWSVFGTRGVALVPHSDTPEARVLRIGKTEADWPACAVWNFPAGVNGSLRLRIRVSNLARGLLVGLTDHFSVPFDEEDVFNNVFNLHIGPNGEVAEAAAPDPNTWHTLVLRWDKAGGTCAVELDGASCSPLRPQRATPGISYVRIKSAAGVSCPIRTDFEGPALDTDSGACWIERIDAEVAAEGVS